MTCVLTRACAWGPAGAVVSVSPRVAQFLIRSKLARPQKWSDLLVQKG